MHGCVVDCQFLQENSSRPASQMSQAASSGYGSARSTAPKGDPPAIPDRGSAAFIKASLRKSKGSDPLFRSLRVPHRVDPPTTGATSSTSTTTTTSSGDIACTHSMDVATLPLRNPAAKNPVPVPAPRFHTLKRHAYQNIPMPTKNVAKVQVFFYFHLHTFHLYATGHCMNDYNIEIFIKKKI